MKKYRHVFFDLDHTLWDFEKNSTETLLEMFVSHKLDEMGLSLEEFVPVYQRINDLMWAEYSYGNVSKQDLRVGRFSQALKHFNITDHDLAEKLASDYVKSGPVKKNLFPNALEVLTYLNKKYLLHIITNGFEEVQFIKLSSSGIRDYFEHVITSEMAGYKKPDKMMFYFCLEKTGASIDSSIMIGDSLEADVLGAKEIGMDQVYFNPKAKPHKEILTYEIRNLNELLTIL